jgi:ABC-type multidrug transport system ATPase subunit
MSSNSAISLKRVTKVYRGRTVLSDLSYEFGRGGVCEIVGKNGSGKSTLLRVLAGVTPLNGGKVVYARDLKRTPIGYVPQRGGHYPELSLRDNALLISSMVSRRGRSLLGRPDLLAAFGMDDLVDRPLRTFSEGMRRIATFLAVWSSQPRIVVADEPLAGVDPANAEKLLNLLIGNDIGAELRIVTSHQPLVEGAAILDLSAGR